jgi:transglutaminase-like putative cysteine protease
LQRELYWRAQVFERFDGISWKVSDKRRSTLTYEDIFPQDGVNEADIIRYEIYQEATDQQMLFSLETGWSTSRDIQFNTDYTLSRDTKIDKLYYYQVETNKTFHKGKSLDDFTRTLNVSLPLYGNEKTRAWAEKLYAESASDQEFMAKVLKNYQREFQYTLQPALLGANPIDEFLFQSRQGFCEHFATSFVYAMRAVGIPARVVAGYMGGEFNVNGNYMLVHQFDAHAWAEVWFEDVGWMRVDPTAWVAPNRINQGIDSALPTGERILQNNFFAARRYDALTNIRLQLDYMNMQWNKWVLGYDEKMQQQVLRNILGKVTAQRITIFMLLCFAFVFFATLITLYVKDLLRVRDKADRLYFKMLKKLSQKKLQRQPAETPNAFAERVSQSKDRDEDSAIEDGEIDSEGDR